MERRKKESLNLTGQSCCVILKSITLPFIDFPRNTCPFLRESKQTYSFCESISAPLSFYRVTTYFANWGTGKLKLRWPKVPSKCLITACSCTDRVLICWAQFRGYAAGTYYLNKAIKKYRDWQSLGSLLLTPKLEESLRPPSWSSQSESNMAAEDNTIGSARNAGRQTIFRVSDRHAKEVDFDTSKLPINSLDLKEPSVINPSQSQTR